MHSSYWLISWAIALSALTAACSTQSARDTDPNRRPEIRVTVFAPTPRTPNASLTVVPPKPTQAPTPEPQPTFAPTEQPPAAAAMPLTSAPEVAPQTAPPISAAELSSDDPRTVLIALHNQSRAAQGLPGYTASPQLQQAAQAQADYLVAKPATELYAVGPGGHIGPNGSKPADRVAATGYAASAADENWAFYNTPQAAFDWWLNDQYHRPQIVSARYTQVGFGVAAHPNGGTVFVAVYGVP